MRITLTLDDKLVAELRTIAVERKTTLAGLIRAQFAEIIAMRDRGKNKIKNQKALEESFRRIQFRSGKKTWRREDLYERQSSTPDTHRQRKNV